MMPDCWNKHQARIEPSRLVVIDGTRIKTNMALLRGWRAKGMVSRPVCRMAIGRRSSSSRRSAMMGSPRRACSMARSMGRVSCAMSRSFLAPTLKPGDLDIMDKPGPHRGEAVRAAIKAAGARLLFLTPCRPDLDPIEQVFAKLKHLLGKTKERTLDATWRRTGSILPAFTAQECSSRFTNSGYGSV